MTCRDCVCTSAKVLVGCSRISRAALLLATSLLIAGSGPTWAQSNPSTCGSTAPTFQLLEFRDLNSDGIGETPVVGSKIDGETIYYQALLSVSTATGQCGYDGGSICIRAPGEVSICLDRTPIGGIPLLCDEATICDPPGVATVSSRQLAYTVSSFDVDVGGACDGEVRALAQYRDGTSHFGAGVALNTDATICNAVVQGGGSCGDGIIGNTVGETCDPPGTAAGANGNTCRGNCTVCGDGILDAGEACDDGNIDNADACANDCSINQIATCGDGIVGNTTGETCDPPGTAAGANGNLCRGNCTVCGDGIVDAGEFCDDGNTNNTDTCANDCTIVQVAACGDGIVGNTAGETCDPPGTAAGANGNLCRGDCTVCGDGVVDAGFGEACDDGNTNNTDTCANDCTVVVQGICGDEIVGNSPGETCDPPGLLSGVHNTPCRGDCTVCGDGIVNGGELCDDGNTNDTDTCANNCTIPVQPTCGDGIVGNTAGETCDPPATPAGANGNLCRANCTVCGDGVIDGGELCDDGDTDNTDICANDCTINQQPACGDGIVGNSAGETCDPPGTPAGANGNLCRANCTVCGDGVIDGGELCDDGDTDNTDICANDCTINQFPQCGDGIVGNTAGETCDPPGVPSGANGNLCRGDCTVCGDGVVDAGEICDDGNTNNTDTCANDCTVPVQGTCGDSIVGNSAGETCDPPGTPAGANGNLCRGDCTVCGDGIVDAGFSEACDDGNTNNTDTCANDCTVPVQGICGDEIVGNSPGETCDPPGLLSGVHNTPCRGDCTVCGDGIVNGGELCDDGNTNDTDTCANNCTIPVQGTCGDGIVGNSAGETCDPPGTAAGANGNTCRGDCTVCGDGIVDAGFSEACDDGNTNNTDTCANDCTVPVQGICGDEIVGNSPGETCDPPGLLSGVHNTPCRGDCTVCGDGIVNGGELCDDGNTNDTDTCANDCTVPVQGTCGDGIVGNSAGETCDPPGTAAGANGNTCRGDCTVCGDGIVDAGFSEACDDGNTNNTDTCANDCTVPVQGICGDEIVGNSAGETCDPPGTPAGANGNACRGDCTVCGDGIVDAGFNEACDDGNTNNTDTCANDCTVPVQGICGDEIVGNSAGETCDPPGTAAGANGNTCRGNCTVCGDGIVDAGEVCDDGNTNNTDGCANDCTTGGGCGDAIVEPGETCDPPGTPAGVNGNTCRGDCTVCGDGIVNTGEACDDGNTTNTDACANDCTLPIPGTCGDGIVGNSAGETCDPPGTLAGPNFNTCRGDCTVCGDGVLDAAEACDDGNTTNTDTCANDCTVPVQGTCGDGIVGNTPGETCDPPGSIANPSDGGNQCRADCTWCGDGNLDAGESCDDGNQNGGDGCESDCTGIARPIGCRITGGGITPDGTDDPGPFADALKATFGGQVGSPCGCVGCFDEFDNVNGSWHHLRKSKNGDLHAKDFNSLVCGCDGTFDGALCVPGDGTPGKGSRPAPANMACFSGVGDFSPTAGKKEVRAAFRVEVEDHGQGPGRSSQDDFYRIRIWIPGPGETPEALAAMACCTISNEALTVRSPNIDDGGEITHGNIQILPPEGKSLKGTCPAPHGTCQR